MLDGTLDAAAAAIDQIPQSEMDRHPSPTPPRADDGKFRAQEPEKVEPETVSADAETPKAEKEEVEAEADDEETYIELPPEGDGKEISRLKLTEVLEGYRKAQTLEQELAKRAEKLPPPEAWDHEIIQTVQTRQQMLQQIETWARLNAPQPPDIALLDQNNINYNPDAYFQQHRQYEAMKAAHEKAQALHRDQAQKLSAEQEAISRVRLQREMAKLDRVWPELKEKAVADKVRSDLESHYGLDAETINSVADARFFALAKDALAYRSSKATAQAAAKVVSAKPKLIPGKARATVNSKTANLNAAMGRLQKSGSIDDATAAIASLL
jgi:hypothetical protein